MPVDHIYRYDVFESLQFADDERAMSPGTREGHVQVIPTGLRLVTTATVSCKCNVYDKRKEGWGELELLKFYQSFDIQTFTG